VLPLDFLLAKSVSSILDVPERSRLFRLDSVILQHPGILPDILALDLQSRFGFYGIQHVVIVTMGTVLVAVFKLCGVFAEALFALFARESHVCGLLKGVIGCFAVAVGAVEPFAATGGADGDLSVENVLAGGGSVGSGRWPRDG